MKVPRLDLRVEDAALAGEISEAISRVVESGRFIGGVEVSALESELADFVGLSEAVTCASGTDALTLGLLAIREMRDPRRDQVIVPAFSFSATASAVVRAGLRPFFVDIDPETFLIDWTQVPDTALAVVPVHLFGRLCSIPQDLPVPALEDACQAFGLLGAGHDGFAAFSFFPSKPLGCYGDGGALVCDDPVVADLVRSYARHGEDAHQKYVSVRAGFNSRLDAIQAAILRVKLHTVHDRIRARTQVAHTYHECLAGVDWLKVPEFAPRHTWHCFVVQVDESRRERFRRHLLDKGIDNVVQYPTPLHRQDAFRQDASLPNAEKASRRVVGLPIWAGMKESQVLEVVDAVRSFGG